MENQTKESEVGGEFKIRTYTKSELAAKYRISVRSFMENIRKMCLIELEDAHYRKTQKYFLPVHVEIIVNHLGTP